MVDEALGRIHKAVLTRSGIPKGRKGEIDATGCLGHPQASVLPPSSEEELHTFVGAIGSKYPILARENVWAAADGLKIRLQQSTNWAIQNRYYNGWHGTTYVNCVFY